jgi:hypothetical protein
MIYCILYTYIQHICSELYIIYDIMQPYIVKNDTVTIYAVVSVQIIYAAKAYMSDILVNYFFGIKYFLRGI